MLATFGCDHDLLMVTFAVERDGTTRIVEDATIELARDNGGICVD